jgi:competence protein ComEC
MKHWLCRKIHHSFTLVALTIGIILGTALSFATNLGIFAAPIWLIIAVGLFIFNFLKSRRALIILSVLAGLILGSFRTNLDLGDRAYIAQFIGKTVEITGTLYEDPDVQESKTLLRLNHLRFADHPEISGSLYVHASTTSTTLSRSDQITMTGELRLGSGSFSAAIYYPTITKITTPDPPDFAIKLRDGFAALIRRFIPSPEVDLSLGYLLGQRRALPESMLSALKIVGLTHIIVASGYNLSILVRFARRFFLKISRFAALFFALILIIGFIAITGFTPSMSRAGLVSILSLIAWYWGRKFHPAKLLLLVAAATLLINPSYIIDLGWLLSFAAFAGIMLMSPLLTAYFYGDKKPNPIAALIIETTSAQILCLPLLLYTFGTFSLISILANTLILPTIPFVMATTFITGLTAMLPLLPVIFGTVSTLILRYHIGVIDFFGSLTQFLVQIPSGNIFSFATYGLIIAAAIYLKKKTNYKLINANVIE